MSTDTDTQEDIEVLKAENARLRADLVATKDQLLATERAYGSFVPREFLHFLSVKNIRDVRFGMQTERQMTVLFSDIRNFTGLSETMTPQENFDFLNSYLSQMEPVIVPFHGLIDKFIGDAVMALFPDSTDDAIQSALAMLTRLSTYNKGRARAGYAPIRIGIGVNTGIVMLGTVGGAGRMETTVISDAVNLASRLEGMTKTFNVPLLISEYTLNSIEDQSKYGIRFLSRSRVKGKFEAQSVYEVFDADPPVLRDAKKRTRKRFEEALAFYYTGDVSRARTRLIRCIEEAPGDEPARVYLDRCEEFLRNNHVEGMGTIDLSQAWSEDYSSNLGEIDSQHRALLAQMNVLTAAVRDTRTHNALTILASLKALTKEHFEFEENLMADTRYPFLTEHAKQHVRFNEHLELIGAEISSEKEDPVYLSFRIKLLLTDWLVNHSIKIDRHLGHHLKSRSGG